MNNSEIKTGNSKLVYIIAGEQSGDLLGAKLIKALKEKEPELEFRGIGGDNMIEAGLEPFCHINQLSVMGFLEVVPHIPRILKLIKNTVDDIELAKPGVVITIDSPAFNFRIAKKIKNWEIPLIHYVAPSVWAYKPKRAEKIANIYDHLLALLPFEPPYFEKEGLKCTFVGHPAVEEISQGDGDKFKEENNIKTEVLIMLTGSRPSEIKRFVPIYKETAEIIKRQISDISFVMPTNHKELLEELTQDWKVKPIITTNKKDSFAAGTLALSKSGTVALELALAGVPMVVTYQGNPITAWIVRQMISVPFASLVNIVHNKELFIPGTKAGDKLSKKLTPEEALNDYRLVIPELFQENCNPNTLSKVLLELLTDKAKREEQLEKSRQALKDIGLGTKPSEKAVEVVLSFL